MHVGASTPDNNPYCFKIGSICLSIDVTHVRVGQRTILIIISSPFSRSGIHHLTIQT